MLPTTPEYYIIQHIKLRILLENCVIGEIKYKKKRCLRTNTPLPMVSAENRAEKDFGLLAQGAKPSET